MGIKKNNDVPRQCVLLILLVPFICSLSLSILGCAGMARTSSQPGGLLTIREFLFEGQNEEELWGLYSYFLLPRKPMNEKERDRYLRFYEAYVCSFQKYTDYEHYERDRRNFNISYWPLKLSYYKMPPDECNNERKDFFIENYDHARAQIILRKLRGITNPGPFIVSYHLPLTGLRKIQGFDNLGYSLVYKEVLVIDLSRIHEELFEKVLSYFQSKVIDNPVTWNRTFEWEWIRINVYSALRTQAEPVLYAFEWTGDFFGLKEAFAMPSKNE